jgi:hypothetical protein
LILLSLDELHRLAKFQYCHRSSHCSHNSHNNRYQTEKEEKIVDEIESVINTSSNNGNWSYRSSTKSSAVIVRIPLYPILD